MVLSKVEGPAKTAQAPLGIMRCRSTLFKGDETRCESFGTTAVGRRGGRFPGSAGENARTQNLDRCARRSGIRLSQHSLFPATSVRFPYRQSERRLSPQKRELHLHAASLPNPGPISAKALLSHQSNKPEREARPFQDGHRGLRFSAARPALLHTDRYAPMP